MWKCLILGAFLMYFVGYGDNLSQDEPVYTWVVPAASRQGRAWGFATL